MGSTSEYNRFNSKKHSSELYNHISRHAESWVAPRALFDATIEYLSHQKIAIPAYSTLQKIISQALLQYQQKLHERVDLTLSSDLPKLLEALISGNSPFIVQQLRQSARNFTGTELQKELVTWHYLQPWMDEVTTKLEELSLSHKNQLHYAERVDYYGAKLKRQSPANQRLYLLCYLQIRHQQSLERITDGFVHHIRQVKHRAKQVAKEQVYKDWQKAGDNISKAADVLRLFVDDSIDPEASFLSVQLQAFRLLSAKDLDSVCRYLGNQKQTVEEAFWQQLDAESTLRTGLLRSLFCCFRFKGTDKTARLSSVLDQVRCDLNTQNSLSDACIDRRLPPKRP